MKEPITYRCLSLDPGGNLGVTISEIDVAHTYVKPLHVETINLNKYSEKFLSSMVEEHGLRFTRFFALRQVLMGILRKWQPDAIVHENAFMHMQRVNAGINLAQYVLFIHITAREYDPIIPIYAYSPYELKSSVKAKKMSSDKGLILEALPKLSELDLSLVDLSTLDEHGIDSIAAIFCYFDKNRK